MWKFKDWNNSYFKLLKVIVWLGPVANGNFRTWPPIFIDREAQEIIRFIASVCPSKENHHDTLNTIQDLFVFASNQETFAIKSFTQQSRAFDSLCKRWSALQRSQHIHWIFHCLWKKTTLFLKVGWATGLNHTMTVNTFLYFFCLKVPSIWTIRF